MNFKKETKWWIKKLEKNSVNCLFNNYNLKIITNLLKIYDLNATDENIIEILNTTIGLSYKKILKGLQNKKPKDASAYIGKWINLSARNVIKSIYFQKKIICIDNILAKSLANKEIISLFDNYLYENIGVGTYEKNNPFECTVTKDGLSNIYKKYGFNDQEINLIEFLMYEKSVKFSSKQMKLTPKQAWSILLRIRQKYSEFK